MVVLGLDFGTRHLGLSVGDTDSSLASPLTSIYNKKGDFFDALDLEVQKWSPQLFVIGLPLNADGTRQTLTDKVELFGLKCQDRYSVKVVFEDERWSTVEARAKLFSKGGKRAIKKEAVDVESATIILQQWLDGSNFR
jgi:putative Holliday junction resolvase